MFYTATESVVSINLFGTWCCFIYHMSFCRICIRGAEKLVKCYTINWFACMYIWQIKNIERCKSCSMTKRFFVHTNCPTMWIHADYDYNSLWKSCVPLYFYFVVFSILFFALFSYLLFNYSLILIFILIYFDFSDCSCIKFIHFLYARKITSSPCFRLILATRFSVQKMLFYLIGWIWFFFLLLLLWKNMSQMIIRFDEHNDTRAKECLSIECKFTYQNVE